METVGFPDVYHCLNKIHLTDYYAIWEPTYVSIISALAERPFTQEDCMVCVAEGTTVSSIRLGEQGQRTFPAKTLPLLVNEVP